MKPEKRAAARPRDRSRKDVWRLRLYVADGSPKSRTALSNLRRICAEHLEGRYQIEVVDLRQNPRLARVVEWHFFGGLTFAEIAEALDVSERTVAAEWRLARAWLTRELDPG